MLFNSLAFAAFLPLVFLLYWWIGGKKHGRRNQNLLLLVASYVFYGWWDPRFLSLIFASSLVDYVVGIQIGKGRHQRKWLLLSLGFNLGLLGVFKYFNFFAESLVVALQSVGLEADMPTLDILLPVGISFYTFQTLSYSIDVYRKRMEPTRDPVAFFTFVSFFPQLVAGPIERASHLLPQFMRTREFRYAVAVTGLRLILWGIFKKVVIADRLAPYVDEVFQHPWRYAGASVFLADLFFAVQIYCDFSGYSDIAIGTARLFGFDLMVNFRTPYLSRSLREFWERWHISLNTWFRDYLYIPLGGNRVSRRRWALNILVVFLVSGLWHGASISFVIWGALHGGWYLIEHRARLGSRLSAGAGWTLTMLVVLLAWFFFRASSAADAFYLISQLPAWTGDVALWTAFSSDLNQFWTDGAEGIYLLVLLGFLATMEILQGKCTFSQWCDRLPRPARWGMYYLLVAWLLLFGAYGQPQQFIYFQF